METQATGFLQSSPGNFSSGRLMFLLWGVFAIAAWIVVFVVTHNAVQALSTFISIAGVATAHKGVQGINENNGQVKQSADDHINEKV